MQGLGAASAAPHPLLTKGQEKVRQPMAAHRYAEQQQAGGEVEGDAIAATGAVVVAATAAGGDSDNSNGEQEEDKDLQLSATIVQSIDDARFVEYLCEEETRMVELAKARSLEDNLDAVLQVHPEPQPQP